MKKFLTVLFLFTALLFGANSDVATKDDIKELSKEIKEVAKETRIEMKENNKLLIELIKSETRANRELLKAHIDESNRRFEQIDKRFELMQKQIDSKFNLTMTLIVASFTLIMGYLLKERSGIKKEVKEEIEPELLKKADKNLLDRVVAVIEEMAKKDESVKEIMLKHGFKMVG